MATTLSAAQVELKSLIRAFLMTNKYSSSDFGMIIALIHYRGGRSKKNLN